MTKQWQPSKKMYSLLERSKTKPPKLYKVILLNDDFTTMEFVIEVLKIFFSMSRNERHKSCSKCIMRVRQFAACTPRTSPKPK